MISFFDYIYNLIFTFYASKEKGASSSSAGIVGGLQAINIMTLYMLFIVFMKIDAPVSKLAAVIIVLFFQVTTYIRYVSRESNSIEAITLRWDKLDRRKKTNMKLLASLYISFSLLLGIGSAIYLGSIGNYLLNAHAAY